MPLIMSTMSIDEATVLRASGFTVTTVKKACSVRSMFEFEDTRATRELLQLYSRNELLPLSPRMLLITRADLYREARSARGGL
jgi:hypothetical protein